MHNPDELVKALEKIERWELPSSGRAWEDGAPMSYGAAFGSNGERDYMREVARKALESYREAKEGETKPEPRTRTLLRSMIAAIDRDDSDTFWMTFGMFMQVTSELLNTELKVPIRKEQP